MLLSSQKQVKQGKGNAFLNSDTPSKLPIIGEGSVGVMVRDVVVDTDDILALNCFKDEMVTVVDVCGKARESYFRNPPPAPIGYVRVRKEKEYISGWVALSDKNILWLNK